ncbi:hypothetical protein J3R30DRAFT_3406671 [Lentinula aciculospora]|uniref:RNA polymerase II-associated protein 1 C-terminal domain-containing protein n=1 Tax=Lentinula aciculospora TaxID=153920 RepID=A0A9W9A432_9AGAR|nr:hypothetical protein J3R30DRAFT_3406671 [Lentinula aciculospora]
MTSNPLVGSVFERKPSLPKPPSSSQSRFASALNSKTGFPPVQHRSQKSSAFLKNLEDGRRKPDTQVPSIEPHTTSSPAIAGPGPSTVLNQNQKQNGPSLAHDWRAQISTENEARVQAMTEEEREAETWEILGRFGPGVSDILRRARENRERNKDVKTLSLEEVPFTSEREPLPSPISIPGSPLVSSLSRSSSRGGTRPNSPSKASRKLRFAELAPDQVHVYPSAPSSPKKALLALPPPEGGSNAISLGTFTGRMKPTNVEGSTGSNTKYEQIEEGSAEYIRQKYFPSAPADNPDLAWMSASADITLPGQTPDLRFDLNGTPIPSSKILSLPTHLGLHHHAEGTRAGYTLDDIFLLTRSTVRAQRAAMLEILVGVIRWLRTGGTKEDADIEAARESLLASPKSDGSRIPPLLKRILFAGLEALPERGAVGVRAMDVVWECVVGQLNATDDLGDLDFVLGGMEEKHKYDGALVTALPLTDVLPQFLNLLLSPPDNDLGDELLSTSSGQTGLSSLRTTPAQQQILSILTHLARCSNAYAELIVEEKGLVEGLLKVFIIPTTALKPSTPNVSAIRLLSILASASRTNAEALCDKIGVADVLLRFVALSANDSVLVEIMLFYTILARYGIYSRVAADAKEVWWKVGDHVATLSSTYLQVNTRLIRAYAGLIESWLVCATDPHRTSPSHELLWSQVKGWEWGAGLASLLVKFTSSIAEEDMDTAQDNIRKDMDRSSTSASLWRSLGAYLEGAKVNGIRGGEEERTELGLALKQAFDANEVQTLRILIKDLKTRLNTMGIESETTLAPREIASLSIILTSAIRLWLGCRPSVPSEISPPFELPFAEISDLCAILVRHSLWHRPNLQPLLVRPLSTFLTYFLRLSPHLPGIHPDLWLAQAFGVVKTLQCGDEEHALQIISQILDMLTPEWAAKRGGIGVPIFVWEEKGGLKAVLGPFLRYEISPERDPNVYIAPLCSSPKSIGMCTTLRIPSSPTLHPEWRPLGLPFHSDWTLSPLNHLLRSGSDYSIFKQPGALPDAWDASEIEIVRGTLALAKVEREVLNRFASSVISVVAVKSEDIVLGCMKVFMLEHGVGTGESKVQSEGGSPLPEVFRDEIVARQMHELLGPYTVKASSLRQIKPVSSSTSPSAPLELASLPLLGTSVPFYQFYTDFLSLYDSISFSHPLFSRLLLPPTSMLYAADYRKLLWSDYSHILRGIRVEVDDVIVGASGGIEEWLYPVETAPEILGAYLSALIKYGQGLQGFTRLLAVHHVAANIWPDFCMDAQVREAVSDDERRIKLLRVVVEQGGIEVMKEVLRYRQSPQAHQVLLFPRCFEIDEPCRTRRCGLIAQWTSELILERVRGVYEG